MIAGEILKTEVISHTFSVCELRRSLVSHLSAGTRSNSKLSVTITSMLQRRHNKALTSEIVNGRTMIVEKINIPMNKCEHETGRSMTDARLTWDV